MYTILLISNIKRNSGEKSIKPHKHQHQQGNKTKIPIIALHDIGSQDLKNI